MDHGRVTQQSAEAPASASAFPKGTTAGSRRRERPQRLRVPGNWPLAIVLAVQAVLSLRLVWANTAFQDEAAYLWAGHLEWANWLHGTSLPPFPTYFSGAPVIYPPLAALADSVGNLAGARILSLVFMLGTTTLLWSTAGRLFGRRAAFFSTALFAVLGPTLHLGSFATYDAMSVFLVALAAWFVVRAGDQQDATGWMVAAGVTLTVADATSYPSAIFDPVVILLALAVGFPKPGGKLAAARAMVLLAIVALLVTLGLLLGGSSYIHGIRSTTLARVGGGDSVLSILTQSWSWTGIVVVAAVCGAVISWVSQSRRAQSWLLTLLACAAALVPAEQASLHSLASLNKHGTLGGWFAAIAAGYAVDRLIATSVAGNMRVVTGAACVIALSFPVTLGAGQSRVFATSWPDSAAFIAIFRPLADKSTGHLLVEDPSIAEYYLPSGSQWQRWSSTRNIVKLGGAATGGPSDKTGIVGPGDAGIFASYIKQGYFAFIALNFADTSSEDQSIAADIKRDRNYHIVQVIPYGVSPKRGPAPEYVIYQKYEPKP
jgi:Dolichyl-phosphate-mannose-protein mannosyltransferase